GTHREIVGSSSKVIKGLSGVHWELVEGNRELAGSLLGACQRGLVFTHGRSLVDIGWPQVKRDPEWT
ncbi:hypothetical protein BHE74_00005909, partial [Ensete ventricosum]